jgi:hypothetical protein
MEQHVWISDSISVYTKHIDSEQSALLHKEFCAAPFLQ